MTIPPTINTLLLAAAALLLVPAPAGAQSFSRAGKDHAIFFAVTDYDEWGDLKNPISDAEAIATVLENKYGFDTRIYRNPDKNMIHEVIQQCLGKQYADDEQLLIYFSGHGEFVPYPNNPEEGKGYFIPRDGKKNDPYRQSYLSYLEVLPDIDNIPCRHILLVVDACYSGSLLKTRSEFNRPVQLPAAQMLFADVMPYAARLAITSGGKERTPDGQYRSPMTDKLLTAFAGNGGPNGVLTFYQLYSFLDLQPRPRTGSFGGNDPNSDFLFLYKDAPLVAPPPAVIPVSPPEESKDWVTDREGTRYPVVQLAGKQWLGKNLNLQVADSWCYDNQPANCDQYGRLYTWEAAKKGCAALGAGWRLPGDGDWLALTDAFGGYWKSGQLQTGKSAYKALLKGGGSGFDALLAGQRNGNGELFLYLARYGLFWSSSEGGADDAWFYWFVSDDQTLYRNYDGKGRAYSVRCLKDD